MQASNCSTTALHRNECQLPVPHDLLLAVSSSGSTFLSLHCVLSIKHVQQDCPQVDRYIRDLHVHHTNPGPVGSSP